jgi:DNA-binding GntR family transcriptional regulator
LTSEGLLTNVPAAVLSIDQVKETFDIRLRFEPWVFAEAIPRISGAENR